MPGIELYERKFAAQEKTLAASGPDWLHQIRRDALGTFSELGFPRLRDEEWRFTRTKPIQERDFVSVEKYTPNGLTEKSLKEMTFEDAGCHRVVLVDGHYAKDLSALGTLPEGARLMSLKKALAEHPDRVKPHLAQQVEAGDGAFVALNTAFIRDGVFLELDNNVIVTEPIHVVFVSPGTHTVSHPRILAVAGKNTEVTIVESYIGTGSEYFTNVVSEFVCDENATVNHCKLQQETETAFHVATQQSLLSRSAQFSTENISFGGALVRNDVNSVLDGEGIDCRLDGLYLAHHRQHVDNHTFIRHAKPHCHSFELYKGILNGNSRGVFNGKIYVDPDAQKTDAKQQNDCILLSDDARLNTNPQLEIFADDVKCTHGATVGQLDETAVFYMRSRGIDEIKARHILIYAFAAEVIERVKVDALREQLEVELFWWLSKTIAA